MKHVTDVIKDVQLWNSLSLYRANLHGANLAGADLHGADLHGATLTGADLSWGSLRGADLRGATLRRADLHGANLHGANLHGANLHGANLHGADLTGADLSQTKGIPTAEEFLSKFESDQDGLVVYRVWRGSFDCPPSWKREPGAVLTETPNPDRGTECGCGVQFSTEEWCRKNYSEPVWRCRIAWRDLADVVVPFNSDKARCARLTLLEELP